LAGSIPRHRRDSHGSGHSRLVGAPNLAIKWTATREDLEGAYDVHCTINIRLENEEHGVSWLGDAFFSRLYLFVRAPFTGDIVDGQELWFAALEPAGPTLSSKKARKEGRDFNFRMPFLPGRDVPEELEVLAGIAAFPSSRIECRIQVPRSGAEGENSAKGVKTGMCAALPAVLSEMDGEDSDFEE